MATLELPYEKVYDLLHKCCTSISPDVLYLMKRAAAKETNPEAKTFLETMLKNVELAGQMDKPVCQSPGFPSVRIRWGEALQPNLTNLMGNITQSVIEATKAGYIRPSIVHPLTRHSPLQPSKFLITLFILENKPSATFKHSDTGGTTGTQTQNRP